MVNELLNTKHPRVIIVAIDETAHPWGHPAFKYVAPAADIAFPPTPLLHDYLYDVVYLPFRQLELFAASMFPGPLGLPKAFDPERYAKTRFDFTSSFRNSTGKWVDMDRAISRDALLRESSDYQKQVKNSLVPKVIARATEADDRVYTDKIAKLALSHHAKLQFVYIPIFDGALSADNRKFYEQYGPVQDNGDLAKRNRLFQNWVHLNHEGAMILSDRVAAAAAAEL